MRLDIRLPLGLLLVVIGGLLAAFGALGDKVIYERSLGINVNLWWGLFMLLVGASVCWASRRSAPVAQSSAEGVRSLEGADVQ